MRQVVLTAAILCAAASAAPAQVKLAYAPDLSPGESTRSQVEVKIEQELVLAGMNVDTNVEQYLTIIETAEEPTDDGTPVVSKFESFILNLTTPIGNLSFDSANRDGGIGLGDGTAQADGRGKLAHRARRRVQGRLAGLHRRTVRRAR